MLQSPHSFKHMNLPGNELGPDQHHTSTKNQDPLNQSIATSHIAQSQYDEQFTERTFKQSEWDRTSSYTQHKEQTNHKFRNHYFYFSSVEGEQYPPVNDVIRSNIVLGFHKFETIPATNQVKVTLFMQCDLKLTKIKFGLYKTMLPQTTKLFYKNLNDFMNNNPSAHLNLS